MHCAKPQTDCCNTCQRTADDRKQAQSKCSHGAINHQQQRGNERDTDEGQAADLALDGVA